VILVTYLVDLTIFRRALSLVDKSNVTLLCAKTSNSGSNKSTSITSGGIRRSFSEFVSGKRYLVSVHA
jgi:hypothetical protein